MLILAGLSGRGSCNNLERVPEARSGRASRERLRAFSRPWVVVFAKYGDFRRRRVTDACARARLYSRTEELPSRCGLAPLIAEQTFQFVTGICANGRSMLTLERHVIQAPVTSIDNHFLTEERGHLRKGEP